MLAFIGAATVTFLVAIVTFVGTILLIDKMKIWNDMGLGAVIPMLAVAALTTIVSISATMFAFSFFLI